MKSSEGRERGAWRERIRRVGREGRRGRRVDTI